MPDEADESLALVLREVRRWLARDVDAAAIERDLKIPPSVLATAGELGLFGLAIPERWGGLGLGLSGACRVVIELAMHDRSVATSIGLHNGLGTRGLVDLGTDSLRDRWLPKLAAGEAIASFAATEAGAGSDLASVRTTAVEDGDHLRLDGEKAYVTNGAFASTFTVLARTPGFGGARAFSLLFVPRDTPGVEIGAEEHKLGIRGSSTVTVRFEGVRVPRDHVLGAPGAGLEGAHAVLVWGRTLMSAGCVGTARAAIDMTVQHVTTRKQFGKPIGDPARSRAHLAAMASSVYAAEALVARVARDADRGISVATTSAMAKVFASETACDTSDRAIQLHGALGYIEDTGVARLLRDCRVTRIFEGANDVLLARVGTELLAAPRDSRESRETTTHAALASARASHTALLTKLRAAIDDARARHGVTVIRRQLLLERVARAATALEAIDATLCAASERGTERDLALAAHAASRLSTVAANELDSLGRTEQDAERDAGITDALYANVTGAVPARERKVTEART